MAANPSAEMAKFYKEITAAIEERGEDTISHIYQNGVLIPIVKSTGKVIGKVCTVSYSQGADIISKLSLTVSDQVEDE